MSPRYLPICPTVRLRCGVTHCRHHAYRAPTGCVLDVVAAAGRAPMGHDQVADVLGVSGTRVQQIEREALAKVSRAAARFGLEPMQWASVEAE